MNNFATTLAKRALKTTLRRPLQHDARVTLRQSLSRASSTLVSSTTTAPLKNATSTNVVDRPTTREFSSYPPGLRGNPQYTVFGETCMLGIKTILPTFRLFGANKTILGIDSGKRGRMIFEWVPREADGKPSRDKIIRFALSPEECGFVLDQLPKEQQVVLLRRVNSSFDDYDTSGRSAPDKVLHITPGQGGMVSFKVDFEIDGVGGNAAASNSDSVGPLEVVVQAGEFQVILSLIQSSIPQLVGWSTMMDVALQDSLREVLDGGSPHEGGGANPRFTSSD